VTDGFSEWDAASADAYCGNREQQGQDDGKEAGIEESGFADDGFSVHGVCRLNDETNIA
jgi:hypothetical protein